LAAQGKAFIEVMPWWWMRTSIVELPFKSAGEVQIARMLERYSIPYLYEHPVAVVDRGKVRVWYPDFVLPEKGMLIEYCGRRNDPAYDAATQRKAAVYRENGLSALMLRPEDLKGRWPQRILDQIEQGLVDRLESWRELRYDATARQPVVRTRY
jgi:hypothetical protein